MRKNQKILLVIGVAWGMVVGAAGWADITIFSFEPPDYTLTPSHFTLADNQITIRLGKDSAQVQACFHLLSRPADAEWPDKVIKWAWPMPKDRKSVEDFHAYSRIKYVRSVPEGVQIDYGADPCQVPASFEIPKDVLRHRLYKMLSIERWLVFPQYLDKEFGFHHLSVEMRVTYTQPYDEGENGQSDFQYILRTGASFADRIGHLRIEVETDPEVQILKSNWELQAGLIDANEIEPEKDLLITLAVEGDASKVGESK